jgi:[histone H3]-trimethyl-L-lysine4 demethylase
MAAGPPIGSAAVPSGGSSSANASSRASPAVGLGGAAPGPTTMSGKAAKKAQVHSNGYHPQAASTPLSAMKSAPLDLSTVERRCRNGNGKALPEKKARPHGLQDAPTYHPTEDEWKDPMEFMRKIFKEAREYGICKIVPPESWNPDFAIDTEVSCGRGPGEAYGIQSLTGPQRFHFRTRKQELNSVEGSKSPQMPRSTP